MSHQASLPRLSHRGTSNIFKILGFLFLFVPLLLAQTQIKSQAAGDAGDQLTESERWVLSQVTRGEEADLNKRFGPDREKCRLRSAFLVELITGGLNKAPVPCQGIKISNALIDGPIKVEYAELEHLLCLSQCIFQDPISFQKSHFKKDLCLNGSQFLAGANFQAMKVDGDISCQKTIFERESVWRDAKISEHFHAEEAEFRSQDGPADFYAMNVGANAYFVSARFHGPANFGLVQIGRELYASQLTVKGPAIFNNLNITTSADFRSSAFQTIHFEKVTWPAKDHKKHTRPVYLSNFTYTGLSIDKPETIDYQAKDFAAIKSFVAASPFNTQSYLQMEAFFTSIGRESWAKEVFISMHDRELAETMAWWDPRRWLKWFFWGQIAGYGRAPFRVFFVSLGFIILGAITFDPKYLAANRSASRGKTIETIMMRLPLSLDRFLPIELGLAKSWDANGRRFFIWFYFYQQQILGWILIPIALASIYSQLK